MKDMDVVIQAFKQLRPEYQSIITDITQRLGGNLIIYFGTVELKTTGAYDTYCHEVAGIVSQGLAKIVSMSQLISEDLVKSANSNAASGLGVFLYKTERITKLEEGLQSNQWLFPRGLGGSQNSLSREELMTDANARMTFKQIMISDALRHVPDVLMYLDNIRETSLYRFCAFSALKAISMLSASANSTHSTQLRAGQLAKLHVASHTRYTVYVVFLQNLRQLPQPQPEQALNYVEQHMPPETPLEAKTTDELAAYSQAAIMHAAAWGAVAVGLGCAGVVGLKAMGVEMDMSLKDIIEMWNA